MEVGRGEVVNEELIILPNDVDTLNDVVALSDVDTPNDVDRFSLREGGSRMSEDVKRGIVNMDSLSSDDSVWEDEGEA